ncbi:MAG: amylo-alpha-1,6-glucosidase [Halobacteriota archaeon]|nr:amylo-alpha-1,6-glucosidase [Halobacteriota archaeon]
MRFDVEVDPVEGPDPSRTKHLILKNKLASWSQSVYSVPFSDKMIPNRDYSYEGFSMIVSGENYHVLDGIAIGVILDGKYIGLRPENVRAHPWKMRYGYEGEAAIDVEYYLVGTDSSGASAVVNIRCNREDVSIAVEPLVDIRHMYADSNPLAHYAEVIDGKMLIGRDNISLLIEGSKEPDIKRWHHPLSWWYKLGCGYRELKDGDIVFRGESRSPISLGEMIFTDLREVNLAIACGNDREGLYNLTKGVFERYKKIGRVELKIAEKVVKKTGLDGDAALRAIALTKFGMEVDGHLFHEAGDFWFRCVWFRDEFEGLLSNINTIFKIKREEMIKDILLYALEYQDEFGRIPNRIVRPIDYNSADATLLAFVLGGEYVKRTGDENLAKVLIEHAEKLLTSFSRGDIGKENGPPVLRINGLISVVPWHSWTDCKRPTIIDNNIIFLPIRIPEGWDRSREDMDRPKYLLPEINAQWILMLRALVSMADLCGRDAERFKDLLSLASENFVKIFKNDKFLHNVAHIDGRTDMTVGSPAMVAISLLHDLFSKDEKKRFIRTIKDELLVKRDGLAFGVLVKNSDKKVYYSDSEYHEGVVWPRDTPYLIRLLSDCGDKETVGEILKSNLDHQMNEGFVFYNSELISLDDGKMTPVKNPVQWWSQWVDPFLK